MTDKLTTIQYLALSLLPDGRAPLGVILPEVRLLLRDDAITALTFMEELSGLETAGLVLVTTEEPGGDERRTTDGDRAVIVEQYESGERRIDLMQQRFDVIELWLTISDDGRRVLATDDREVPSFPLDD